MKANSQPLKRRNHARPASVLVNPAANGGAPASNTNMPARTTINMICATDTKIANRPSTITNSGPNAPPETALLKPSIPATFLPNPSPCRDASTTPRANSSAALTARLITASPQPDTTTSVSSPFNSSRPGSARCSHAIRAPPRITAKIAAAAMYHHNRDWINATAGDADVPSALVTFGVPIFTHTVPSDATAFATPSPTASASAPTALFAAPPTTSPTLSLRWHTGLIPQSAIRLRSME